MGKRKLDEDSYEESYDDELIYELADTRPREFKKLKLMYKKLSQRIVDKQVTLVKILTSGLPDTGKEQAIQLYAVLRKYDQDSLQYVELNQLLYEILYYLPTEEDINSLSVNRILADEYYKTLIHIGTRDLYSEEWFTLKTKLNNLIKPSAIKLKIMQLDTSNEIKQKLFTMDENSKKLKWYLSLPYNKVLPHHKSYTDVYQYLNQHLYGMNMVKEKLLIYYNQRLLNDNNNTTILALRGPPGVGKTKIIQVFAEALEYAFGKINFGGTIDSTLLTGGDKMWLNSSPSMILQLLSQLKCADPIILLDEIDKIGTSSKGLEVENALLHILDPTQHKTFNDTHLNEFPHDISKMWFIASMNDSSKLSKPLLDRLYIIDVPAYTKNECHEIITNYILPSVLKKSGLQAGDISISADACRYLLSQFSEEKLGMRKIEHDINDVVAKISLAHELKNNQDIKLSYHIPDLKYPYVIDGIIKKLIKKKEPPTLSYYS